MIYRVAGLLAAGNVPGYTPVQGGQNAIPGQQQVQDVINSMAYWGLLLAGAALVISAVIWAFGANSQNSQQATAGKRGVLIAIAAAIVIGAGPKFIDWAFTLGSGA